MLSTKYLVFKERPAIKLIEWYVEPYTIEEVVLTNVVKLRLPALMRIHPVVKVSRVVRYKRLIKRQKVEELKPIEIDREEKRKVEKILNKRMIWGSVKYLVR